MPVFTGSFSAFFEQLSNNKVLFSAAWINGKVYCIFILLLKSDNDVQNSVSKGRSI